jgi:hypothetical protein
MYLTTGGFLLMAQDTSFDVGDVVSLFNHDSNRKLQDGTVTIVDISPTEQNKLLVMLKNNGYDYTPIKPFKSRSKYNSKLRTSYSVKSTSLK